MCCPDVRRTVDLVDDREFVMPTYTGMNTATHGPASSEETVAELESVPYIGQHTLRRTINQERMIDVDSRAPESSIIYTG